MVHNKIFPAKPLPNFCLWRGDIPYMIKGIFGIHYMENQQLTARGMFIFIF
jgi:hypothetical protein